MGHAAKVERGLFVTRRFGVKRRCTDCTECPRWQEDGMLSRQLTPKRLEVMCAAGRLYGNLNRGLYVCGGVSRCIPV